jgi:hypothetical protein
LAEYRGAAAVVLWAIIGLLVLGRALHAAGLLTGKTPLRAAGMLATYAALLIGAGGAVAA